MIDFEQKTPTEIDALVATRVRVRRKELGLTQKQLSDKAGMSLASTKRFEQKGLIAFDALIRITVALGCKDDLDALDDNPNLNASNSTEIPLSQLAAVGLMRYA